MTNYICLDLTTQMITPQISTFFWKRSDKLQKKWATVHLLHAQQKKHLNHDLPPQCKAFCKGKDVRWQPLHAEIIFTNPSRNTFSVWISLWVCSKGAVTHTDMSEGNRNLAGPRWHGRDRFFPQCNKNSPLTWGDGGHAGALKGRIPSPHATAHCCQPAHFTGLPTALTPWLRVLSASVWGLCTCENHASPTSDLTGTPWHSPVHTSACLTWSAFI